MDTRGIPGRAGLIAALTGCLAGCGNTERALDDREPKPQTSADVRSAAGYRIVGTPVAAVETTPNGITTAVVTIRTSRPLPFEDGAVTANIRLDGTSGASPAIGRGDGRRRHCYVQPVDEFPRRAQTGDRTLLTIAVPGTRRSIRMTLRFVAASEAATRYKRLCGPTKFHDEPDSAP